MAVRREAGWVVCDAPNVDDDDDCWFDLDDDFFVDTSTWRG